MGRGLIVTIGPLIDSLRWRFNNVLQGPYKMPSEVEGFSNFEGFLRGALS